MILDILFSNRRPSASRRVSHSWGKKREAEEKWPEWALVFDDETRMLYDDYRFFHDNEDAYEYLGVIPAFMRNQNCYLHKFKLNTPAGP